MPRMERLAGEEHSCRLRGTKGGWGVSQTTNPVFERPNPTSTTHQMMSLLYQPVELLPIGEHYVQWKRMPVMTEGSKFVSTKPKDRAEMIREILAPKEVAALVTMGLLDTSMYHGVSR